VDIDRLSRKYGNQSGLDIFGSQPARNAIPPDEAGKLANAAGVVAGTAILVIVLSRGDGRERVVSTFSPGWCM
jgi:hypothetical protein